MKSEEMNSNRKSSDKRMTLKDAVNKFVVDGSTVALGGMGGVQCVCHAHEIARQKKKNLTMICESPAEPADLLIGAGCIKRLEVAWIAYAVAGLGYNFRRAIENKVPNEVEIEEYSNYGMSLRFLAGAMDVPFLPTKSFLGSDFPKYNDKIKIIEDPYEKNPVALVPAARPDVAFIHCSRADKNGNAQFFGISASGENIARAAKHTIITCERIVDTDVIRQTPNNTLVPGFAVDAVCEVPFGSHPWNVAYEYAYDLPFQMDEVKAFRTREGFEKWIDKYIYSVDDWNGYLQKVGFERLYKLQQIEKRFNANAYRGY